MLKEKILNYFLKNENKIVTGGFLAKKYNVSRSAIWKNINILKDEGFCIQSLKNKGYIYEENKSLIIKEKILNNLNTKFLGRNLDIFDSINSTNTYLKQNTFKSNGYTVISNEQTDGRGRRGKSFISSKNEGIYMSFLLKPDISYEKIKYITIYASVAICNALKKSCNIDCDIKWVNDIFYKNKKLCGILTEAIFCCENNTIEGIIVGIGINIRNVSNELKDIATSIFDINNVTPNKNLIIAEILNEFEKSYLNNFLENEFNNILNQYKEKLFIINKQVKVIGNETFLATVKGMNDNCELIVTDKKGKTHFLKNEDVSLKIY